MVVDEQIAAGGRRFALDVRGERQAMGLRKTAAVVALIAGAWLMTLPYAVPRLFALAGFAFAALWLFGAVRTRKRLSDAAAHYLELATDGLRLAEGGAPLFVPWTDVRSVAIDHDRLNVVVARKSGPDLVLEPQYQGLNLSDLGEAVHAAFARTLPTPPTGALARQDG